MATLALSLAGQVVGGAVGGPIGATIGRALGALAGSAIDSALFADKANTTGADIRLQGSSEGAPIPRLYGWSRLSGNIIWATELERLDDTEAGAKGTSSSDSDEIAASFALGLCEGEVHRLGRIWADGELLETSGLTIRFHRGSETQAADSLIAARQADAPAYRGLCYLVFERLPLSRFGNRIPVLSVEVCRVVGVLEPLITAVTVIPGATEFGYDPVPRVRLLGHGVTAAENTHLSAGRSDWSLSIDELTALCPNLEHVSLVVAWFGDDLRAAHCTLAPRVEAASRTVKGTSWEVGSTTRATAAVVSTHDGSPAYGGTPSDAAVLAAIADLKARGLKVTLYPIVLMDIPAGNALGQPAYPWRGRIAVSPGAEGTSAAATEAASFAAQYRAMLVHYANLAVSAGGVDMLVLGSEMRGMSFARGAANSFPFVTSLVSLAAEVRGIVGGTTTLTYGADWSEYAGLQPGGGERFFHLDALWASPHIDAVGIDCYWPLSDWRDGGGPDAADWDSPYDRDYLSANIVGGEGYDWFYASDADRSAGTRTPISDGAHGEPWVWRVKDLVNWWSNAHHDRPGGVRNASATAWMPMSKPILLIEAGCGAVDKGTNQPNLFSDPKSAESGVPYFSNGVPDPLIQRQALRAILSYWADPANNPSDGSGGRMMERIYLWTWDARPFPAFPGLNSEWADGANHATGHWLTGRLGGLASDEMLRAIAADYSVPLSEVAVVPPFVEGLAIAGPTTARAAMAPLFEATGLSPVDTPAGLRIGRATARGPLEIGEVAAESTPLRSRRQPDPGEAVGQLALSYADRERSYLAGSVTALRDVPGVMETTATALVLDLSNARRTAEALLRDRRDRDEVLQITLPPSALALEAGDAISLEGRAYEVTAIRDTLARRIEARLIAENDVTLTTVARTATAFAGPQPASAPELLLAHLPPAPEAPTLSRLVLGAYASPWPGQVEVTDEVTGAVLARLDRPAAIGTLTAPLLAGAVDSWDMAHAIELTLAGGHLASRDDDEVLAGANRIAVATDAGEWEIIGFATAALTGPGAYRLTRLLRGQGGSDAAIGPAGAGNAVLFLDGKVTSLAVPAGWLDGAVSLRSFAGASDAEGTTIGTSLSLGPVLPLRPVHLSAQRDGSGDIMLTWLRRSRADTDAWSADDAPADYLPERYRVMIYNGLAVVQTLELTSAATLYTAAQQTADFGAPPSAFTFTVAQLSPVFGPGPAASGAFAA